MKISKDNPLWKCYCRFHADEKKIPHPKNLCNFWWTAIAGLLIKVFYDWPLFIMMLVLTSINILICSGVYLCSQMFPNNTTVGIIIAPLILFVLLSTILFPFIRIIKLVEWIDKKRGDVKVSSTLFTIFIIGVIIIFILLIVNAAPNSEVKPDWGQFGLILLVMVGIGLSIFIFTFIYMAISKKQFWETFVMFLKAKKQKVCPLVEPPDDFDLEKKEPIT